ncbi:hypothetical protein BH24ACT3_BH24ACT3_14850 [soil metagenome]
MNLTRDALRHRAFRGALRMGQWASLPTAGSRSVPDFLLMGGQRCGTTSLYRYLTQHEGISFPRLTKGVHYFDEESHRSGLWYRSNFPLDAVRTRASERLGHPVVVGEACPYYLFHPKVVERIQAVMPAARLIAVLRDPIARAWSGYQHERRRGYEHLTFEEALAAEPERLAGAEEVLRHRGGRHFSHQHHSYVARGQYADQLRRLWDAFPREQTLVLYSADLERDPDATVAHIHRFLGIPVQPTDTTRRWNETSKEEVPPALHRRLAAAFAASDEWLIEHLAQRPPWVG